MKIKDWETLYENAQSRKVHRLSWVPVPNKHDGERYSELMARKDAAEIFSAWILLLQVASRSQNRGSLLRDNGKPHTPESLSIKTRGNKEWFKKAIPYLLEIGWIEQLTEDNCEDYQNATSTLPEDSYHAGIEGKGREGKEQNISCEELEILSYLNEKAGTKYRNSPSHMKMINARLLESSAADCKKVVDFKCAEWGKDPKMRPYLRPETLFNATKFHSYLGQADGIKPKSIQSRSLSSTLESQGLK